MTTTAETTIRIQRYNPDIDKKPYYQDFVVDGDRGSTVLDAMQKIKGEQDGTLTFRRSCRHAICGSCATNINGQNKLACKTPITDVQGKKNRVVIRPLPYLPVIKDLVVDRSSFWTQYQRGKPWLLPPDDTPKKEFSVSPEEIEALNDAETCIMCGACYSACQVIGLNKQYIGPHALLKAFLRVMDPRDSSPAERLDDLAGDEGVYRCHTIFNCIDACPKGLNPTQSIETLRKLAQKSAAFERERHNRQEHFQDSVQTN